jgi:hypothetical protein
MLTIVQDLDIFTLLPEDLYIFVEIRPGLEDTLIIVRVLFGR